MSKYEEKKNYRGIFSGGPAMSIRTGTTDSTNMDGPPSSRRTRGTRFTNTTETGTNMAKSVLTQNYMKMDEILSNTTLS
jgi:hypothetical protein